MNALRVNALNISECASCGQDHAVVAENTDEGTGRSFFTCPVNVVRVDLGDSFGAASS